ncbi:PREDICTED: extensin-3-like [Nicotiana attenuata]|uniref:extensin-3-like n=1 Tax=Nicotiana attenuata TaxID=49451 RepID=UPI000905A340|nr:PREDICTED: extensin-3-like [Nicotiana attenuata]
MGKPFAEAIKIGEMVENGLKTGPIMSQSAIRATSQDIQSGSGGVANRKKKEEEAMMASSLRNPHQPRVMNAQPYARPQQHYNQNRAPPPKNNPPHQAPYNPRPPQNNYPYNARPREPPRKTNFTPIGESYSNLFPKLVQMGLLQPVPPKRLNPESPSYRPEQKRVVLRDEEVPDVTNNPLSAHNNGPAIGIISKDKEFDPALKAIIAIADVEKKPKAAANPAMNEKKSNSTPQSIEKAVEAKTWAVPPKDAILYGPRAPRKEQLVLSPPKRFEQNNVTLKVLKMYVPKGTYVVRGPLISPRLTEPVVISRAPQNPMKDPTAVPWNYNKAVVTYKGKEIMGEVNETNPSGKYLNLEELNKTKQKRFPVIKPVRAEEAEEFFQKMKTSDYAIIDQLRKSPSQVSLLSLLISSNEHQKALLKTLNAV